MIIQNGWFRNGRKNGVWHKVRAKSVMFHKNFKFMCQNDRMGKDEYSELFMLKRPLTHSRLCKNCVKAVEKYCTKIKEGFPS